MKIKFCFLTFTLLALVMSSCRGETSPQAQNGLRFGQGNDAAVSASSSQTQDIASILKAIDELSELERAGAWFQGMALTESTLRENAGDFAGAVAAAFKELSQAYGMGLLQKDDLKNGLKNVLSSNSDETVAASVNAILSFLDGQWEAALLGLSPLFNEADEPDGFGRWIMLVCELELASARNVSSQNDKRAGAAYRSIRARYAHFPEYWYRGARAFSGAIAAEFAENCINASAQGPFSNEAREILASVSGLKHEDGSSIRTKREIESVITQSVSSGNPRILDSLLPLISLPDNAYTIFAVGALRALSANPAFRDYFYGQTILARGRLAERLSYICRG